MMPTSDCLGRSLFLRAPSSELRAAESPESSTPYANGRNTVMSLDPVRGGGGIEAA